ncbi:MAG: DUF5668 domain-containing protein [Acidobacteriota bacterium]
MSNKASRHHHSDIFTEKTGVFTENLRNDPVPYSILVMEEKKLKEIKMEEKKKFVFDTRVIVGILIIAAGVILLMGTLGYDIDFNIWDFWPVILIAIGLKKIVSPQQSGEMLWGFFLLALGVLFQLSKLDYIDFYFQDIWPFILIFIGFQIIRSGTLTDKGRHNRHFKEEKSDENKEYSPGSSINISAILGGGEYNFSNKKLKGGKISAIMGGCEIDLRNGDFEGETLFLDTFALMGGIEIRVPQKWEVIMEGTPILGAMENKTSTLNGTKKKLIIKGMAIMGAVEVMN